MVAKEALQLAEKFVMVYRIEKTKYARKGLVNTIIGFSLLSLMILAGRQIGIRNWPEHVEDKSWFLWKWAVIFHYAAEIWTLLIFLPGYLNLLPCYENYKINKKSKWPWERDNWGQVKRRLFYNLIINQIFVYPLIVSLSSLVGVKQRFDELPSFWEILRHIIIIYLIDDFFFYWGHRLFHEVKVLYKMHKIHHEYDKVFTAATQYFHPFDFAVANVMPSALAFSILGARAHCFTYFFWICYKVSLSTEGHSGYQFPWSPTRILPFVLGPCYHDHHHSQNVGNYSGSCYIWDWMMGTGDHFFEIFLKDDGKMLPALT